MLRAPVATAAFAVLSSACTPPQVQIQFSARAGAAGGSPTPLDVECAVDPVADITTLDADPSANIAYRSGNSQFSFASPTSHNGALVHRQGIGRLFISEGIDRGNYFVVSSSTRAVDPGFEVVQLASTNAPGPLGSLASSRGISRRNDRIVNWVSVDNARLGTNYNHAGGLQVIGRVVAVALESYKQDDPDDASFALWYLQPRFPQMSELVRRSNESEHGSTKHAGSVGLTRLPDGRYLVMLFGRHAREVELFISRGNFLPWASDEWISVGAWDVSARAGTIRGNERWPAYQSTQLIQSCGGELFLLGGARIGPRDWVQLWSVELDPTSLRPTFTKRAERHLYCSSRRTYGHRYCKFSAGSGVYIGPTGHLVVYGVEGKSCVAGDCGRGSRRDGNHVGVREFAPASR